MGQRANVLVIEDGQRTLYYDHWAARRLDRELRYANWISDPAEVNGTWYVDYAIPSGCRS